ncbi:MAG: T9SS type A sorting domain-containing protein [Bacteroidales bacterium]|nr:T9SS type A sorting domain-containing protein [Bacteroidales bacterium]MCF8457679.1 T9SS type A sorting domain-containing protein [Bacteroidales bacterium]
MKHYLSLKNVWVTLLMLTIATSINAQTLPWTYANTGVNHTILIQPGTVTINGTSISSGDYVGVFFDLSGTLTCGGYVEYTGGVTALSAWGSESGVDNGFQNNEAFSWKVWVASTGAVVDMVATYSFGGGFYTTNAMSGILTLEGTAGSNPLSASSLETNVSCFGLCDGAIDVTASDGTTPYSYLWSNGASVEDLSGICAGTYTVTVSDVSDNVVLNITITEPSEIALTDIATNADCFGAATGAIDMTVAGGSSPYTYLWSNGSSSEDLTGILAGSYSITVTDDNGCTGSALFSVSEPTELALTQNSTNILCYGNTTGAIDITVSGGTVPYSFSWSNSSTNEDITNLGAGSYSLTITDGNNCTISNSYTITEATELGATATATEVLCNGDATGSIDLTVTGGTMPYTYSWSNGSSTEDIANVMAGTYAYTVTDANGCMFTGSAQVSEPAALSASSTITNVDCYGNQNGAIDLTISGGVAPLNIVWSNSASTEDISGVGPGIYEVLIFDANNCTFTDSYTITESAEIIVTPIFSDYSGYNVSTNGASDGLIDVTVSGGVSPYTFTWSNGGSTNSVAGLAAGTHYLTVTDALACTIVESYILTEPAPIGFGATGLVANASCFSVCDGSIDLTVVGGTTPYTYSWSNGASIEDVSGLCSDTYDVTVTDASGGAPVYQPFDWTFVNTGNNHTIFISTGIVTIDGSAIQPGDVIGVFYNSGGNMVCAGYIAWNNASTACTAWGSEPGLNNGFQANEAFNWKVWRSIQGDVVDMTATYQGLPFANQGNYITNGMSGLATLTGTPSGGGGGGVSIIESFTVTEPAQLLASGTAINNLCYGGMTGSIDLSVSGGTPPYLYNWSNSAVTEDISGLAAGYYDVIVSDANQCSTTFGITITQPTEIMATAVATDVLCFGDMNGSIDLTVSGGTMPYSFSWSNGGNTEDLSGIGAGLYAVTVTDANGCIYMTSATVNQPVELSSLIDSHQNVTCFGYSNGYAHVLVSGGTAPYTYLWSNGATSEEISGVVAGLYYYTVTDANSCTLPGSITLFQPDELVGSGMVSDYNGYSVSINGASDGWIDLSILGGTTPYTYAWSNGATTQDLNNIPAGNYSYTVTDINGCTATGSFTLTQPNPSSTLQISAAITHVACNGNATGAIDLSISGGTAPYDVEWSNTAMTEDLSGLEAGTYMVTVMDLASNIATGSYTVNQPTAIGAVESITDVMCNGDLTGSIELTVSGGIAPYTYSWSSGASTKDIMNIGTGMYDVTITDANMCEYFGSYTVSGPAELMATEVTADILCNGAATGSIDLTISGGVMPYSFAWSNGAATEDLSAIAAGAYAVTITDGNMCSYIGNYTIYEPAAIMASEAITNVMCNGILSGGIDLSVSGGVGPFTFAWSNGAANEDIIAVGAGTYEVTISDANQCEYYGNYTITEPDAISAIETITNVLCNGASTGAIDLMVSGGAAPYNFSWSNSEVTEDISGLMAGTYNVIITDANNCVYVGNYSISEPAVLDATEAIVEVLCNGAATGSINMSVSGGVAPYSFAWSNSETSEDLMNIMAGMYDVTITDANGCEFMNSYTISEPAALMVSEAIVNIMCNGDANGSIDLTVSGGISPYTFAWSNSEMTEDLMNLSGGTYGVTVTDANGCEFYGSYDVLEPAALVVAETLTHVLCNGDATGAIDLTVSGGVAPYSFMWSTSDVSEDLSNLVAGTYDVTVTDANGCVWMASFTITEPDAFAYGMTSSDPLCAGDPTGYINFFVSGGTSPYTFLWSDGSTNEDLSGVVAGSYSLTVTDAYGCTMDFAAVISEPAALSVTETITNIDCYGGNNGMIEVVPAGGIGLYGIVWANAATDFILTNLIGGTYNYTITDFNSCEYYGSAVVVEPGLFVANGVVSDVACFGGNDGTVDLSVVGGTAPFTYSWSDGSTNEDLMNGMMGTYTVSVVDVNGCAASASFTINEPAGMTTTGVVVDAMIYGGNQGSIDITVVGGLAPYTFIWSSGDATEDIVGLIAGDYYVTITDASSCSVVAMYSVSEPAQLSGSGVVSDFNGYGVSCFGSTDGSIDLTILGGTPPYDFEWSNGETTEDISGLAPGNYDVTVSYTYGTGPTGTAFNWTAPNTGANHTIFIPDAQINGTSLNPGDYVGVFFDQSGVLVCGGYVEWTGVSGGTAVTAWGAESGMDNGFQDGETFIWKVWRASDQQIIDMTAVYAPIFPNLGSYSTNGISGLVSLTGTSSFFSVYEDVMLSFTITEPTEIMLAGSTTNVLCFGDMTGAIDLTITGGVMPYVVEWSNGAMSEDISGLASGMYSVTVMDANSCSMTAMYEIFQNALLEASGMVNDVNCNGGTDGSVDLSVMGGTMPYSFLWSNGETTEDIASLSIGTYGVTVSDVNGCMAYGTFVIDQPDMLTESAVLTGVACSGGNDGAIDLTVLGGATPYTYEWSNGSISEDLLGVVAGTYSFTVTDANNCVLSGMYTISQSTALSLTSSVANATCNSYQNGSINLTVSGGTAPYTYYWSNSATSEDVSGLGAGGYSVMVTDYNGCSASALYFINQPAAINITGVISNVTCNGYNNGAINVSVSGGTPAYSYIWSNSAITQDLSGVTAGTYTITVSDVNTCSKNKTFIVTQPAPLNVTAVMANVSCNGANNGSIDQTVSGGTAPYTYNWSNGGTTQDKYNLAGGTYYATVTDTKGCSVINTYIITEPTPLTLTSYISTYGPYNVSTYGASNGFVVLFPTGGTPPYLYTWANGSHSYYRLNLTAGNYGVTITDLNGCSMVQSFTLTEPAAYTPVTITPTVTAPSCNGSANGAINLAISNGVSPYTYLWDNGSTTMNRSGLAAGTYTVSVTDATSATQTLAVEVTQPDPIAPTYVVNNVSCNGMANGSIDLSVTGGTAPYTYNWGMSVMQDISNLAAGVYTVTIKDANLCTAVQSVTVTQPAMLALTFNVTDPLCSNDGSIDLAVTGGTAPYAYLWSNGSTDEDPANLMAGTYMVDVLDANGCMANGSVDVTMNAQLQVTLVGTNITCYGAHNGSVDLTIAGGVMPYSIVWDNSSSDEDLINLAAGTFTVTVGDANSCSVTGTVTIAEPAEILLSAATSNVSCNGGMNGSITLTVTGGVLPYAYSWADGVTAKDRSNLMAGTYMVTVSDANACMKVETYTITEPDPIVITYTSTNLSCYKVYDGSITISITGGTSPYTFLWSNLANSQNLTALKAGSYSVKIWDANGCFFQSQVITITQPNAFTNGLILAQGVLCSSDQNAELDLTVSGGTMPYTFNWNNGTYNTEDLSGLGAGTYAVVVSDANNCMTTNTITISAPNPLISQVFSSNVSCYGGADGAAAVVMTGGTWPYSFEWSDGLNTIGTNEIIWPISVGTYSIQVTDANGCITTNSATVLEPDPLGANITVFGTTNLTVLAVPTGGTSPYTYSWQPSGATAPFVKNIIPGTTLTVTIIDANGCTYTTTFVAQPSAPTVAGNIGGFSNQNSSEAFKLESLEDLTLVYPNPNNTGLFYVSVPDQESISSMKVYDSSGRLISSNYQKNVNGDILLDIQNISKGIYYLRISDEAKRVIVKKLVITQ